MSTTIIHKNNATPDDTVYLAPIDLFCHMCKPQGGRPKRRGNLWSLYLHFKRDHNLEPESDWKPVVDSLIVLVKEGVIRP